MDVLRLILRTVSFVMSDLDPVIVLGLDHEVDPEATHLKEGIIVSCYFCMLMYL